MGQVKCVRCPVFRISAQELSPSAPSLFPAKHRNLAYVPDLSAMDFKVFDGTRSIFRWKVTRRRIVFAVDDRWKRM